FQAEDGIRDFHVTGVQTCALPICHPLSLLSPSQHRTVGAYGSPPRDRALAGIGGHGGAPPVPPPGVVRLRRARRARPRRGLARQIGRASCRERAESAVGAESWKKK